MRKKIGKAPKVQTQIFNDMSQFTGGANPNIFGINPSVESASNPDALFKNLRYYLVSNNRQLISEAYAEIGLVQTVVDVPVDDALRGGVKISSSQLSEDQIIQLGKHCKRKGDFRKIGSATKWSRLFGGGAIIILSDQDPATPLDFEALTPDSNIELRSVDMWELVFDPTSISDNPDPTAVENSIEYYRYYNVDRLHRSRVLRINGIEPPSFVRPRLRGWGMSVVEKLVSGLNQYNKAKNLSYEVLDEFKLDIFKLKGLAKTLSLPDGLSSAQKRVTITNLMKSYQNALVMDSEDDFDHKQLTFAGLAEVQTGNRMQIASDLRMPLTRVFGVSAAGFSSGEDDIEIYNGMVEGEVREPVTPLILKVLEVRCQELFGMIPDDLEIEFEPLRVLSAEGEENVKTLLYNRIHQARVEGLIGKNHYCEAVNKANIFGVHIDPDEIPDTISKDEKITGEGEESGTEETKLNPPTAPEPKEEKEVKNEVEVMNYAPEFEASDAPKKISHIEFLEALGNIQNGTKWEKAKEASKSSYGEVRWPFVMWLYEKLGGKK
jgi:phage-related protein (TIGR01555 family)